MLKLATAYNPPKQSPMMYRGGFDEEPNPVFGLALTGGGSHGAFEAGVLEAILPTLHKLGLISVLTGTSAGALNAVAAGSGLNASGPDEAIIRLRQIWNRVSANGNPYGREMRSLMDMIFPKHLRWPNIDLSAMSLPPMTYLQTITPSLTAQFIAATARSVVGDWEAEVQNGDIGIAINTILEKRNKPGEFEHQILSGYDLTPHGVGASANLKQLGVHRINDCKNPNIAGRLAYDGAYFENGSLDPHLKARISDLLMIILQDRRDGTLDKAGALKHSGIHIDALNVASQDEFSPRLHAVEIETLGGEIAGLSHINDSSKMNTDPEFINALYDGGLKTGHAWLEKNVSHLGQMSSYRFYEPAMKQFEEMSYT